MIRTIRGNVAHCLAGQLAIPNRHNPVDMQAINRIQVGKQLASGYPGIGVNINVADLSRGTEDQAAGMDWLDTAEQLELLNQFATLDDDGGANRGRQWCCSGWRGRIDTAMGALPQIGIITS